MLKKCALFIRGCIRMRTMIIVLILLVTFYVFKNKYEEISNLPIVQNSRESGALFYLEGIWGKMKRIQQISDGRSQRAMELFEDAKTINEKSGLFSLNIPNSWKIISEEGASGKQLAKIVIESPGFSQRTEGGDVFYDNGAQLIVQVVQGEDRKAKLPDGGYGSLLIRKSSVDISEQKVDCYVVNETNVKDGEIINAHILHNGNTYNFRLADNPRIFTGGEFSFQEILHSLKF